MKKCQYNYLIEDISDEEGHGYAAIIPKFPKVLVMADSPQELHEQVIETLDLTIEELKKSGKPIPPKDNASKYKGKIMLRISPKLHEQLFYEAQAHNFSLNKYIESKLK